MSPLLGDHFPKKMREDYSNRILQIGSVFKTHVEIAEKPKRWVVVGFSGDGKTLGAVLLNSEVNPNVFPTAELKALHLKLEYKKERGYLTKQCYVDCSEIIQMSTATIKAHVVTNPECFLGEIDKIELGSIHQLVSKARTIPIKTKKKFSL